MANKTDHGQVAAGDYLSETQYYKVTEVSPTGLSVVNERGFSFTISKGIVEEGIFSANQFTEVKEVTRTELIEVFSQVGDTVFKVCYHTQPKVEEINDAIEAANKGKIIPIDQLKRLVKTAYKGKERILTGYLIKVETGFGRSMVIDLEADTLKSTAEWDSRIRQVDHRTLKWLITKNIKWIVKGEK